MSRAAFPASSSPAAPLRGAAATPRHALLRAAGVRYAARGASRERRRALQQAGLWLQADDVARVQARLLRLAMAGVARSPLGAPDASRAPVDPIGSTRREGSFLVPGSPRRRTPRSVGELRRRLQDALESPEPSLALALERVVGRSDRLPVVFFERGALASRAVCRVLVHDPITEAATVVGTGVLVAPGLLLTTHLALPDAGAARHATIEFRHEYRVDGQLDTPIAYALEPRVCFLADPALDFALVAVADPQGTLGSFGFHPLVAEDAAAVVGETLSVIEHPGGEPKQVALRGCHLVDVLDDFVHYTLGTTCAGSPGAPVFNDQWELVALQHTVIPAVDAAGRPLMLDGTVWDAALPEDRLRFVAGEGLRVSRLVAALRDRLRDGTLDEATRAALGWLLVRAGGPAVVAPVPAVVGRIPITVGASPALDDAFAEADEPPDAGAAVEGFESEPRAPRDHAAPASDAPLPDVASSDASPAEASAHDAAWRAATAAWAEATGAQSRAPEAASPAPVAAAPAPPVEASPPTTPPIAPPIAPPAPPSARAGEVGATTRSTEQHLTLTLPSDRAMEVTLRVVPIVPASAG